MDQDVPCGDTACPTPQKPPRSLADFLIHQRAGNGKPKGRKRLLVDFIKKDVGISE